MKLPPVCFGPQKQPDPAIRYFLSTPGVLRSRANSLRDDGFVGRRVGHQPVNVAAGGALDVHFVFELPVSSALDKLRSLWDLVDIATDNSFGP